MASTREIYLETARVVPAIVEATASDWHEPSALEGWTVGGLVGHFVRGVGQTVRYLRTTTPPRGPQGDALDYFERLAPKAGDFAKDVLARGIEEGADGPEAVAARVRGWIEQLEQELPKVPKGFRVAVFEGYATTIEEYMKTRLVELVVHHADLAETVEVPELPVAARTEALIVLAGLARRMHGDKALINAFARDERATPISVF